MDVLVGGGGGGWDEGTGSSSGFEGLRQSPASTLGHHLASLSLCFLLCKLGVMTTDPVSGSESTQPFDSRPGSNRFLSILSCRRF